MGTHDGFLGLAATGSQDEILVRRTLVTLFASFTENLFKLLHSLPSFSSYTRRLLIYPESSSLAFSP
ncbi:uncharacterized [Tachysurus ichikawai]